MVSGQDKICIYLLIWDIRFLMLFPVKLVCNWAVFALQHLCLRGSIVGAARTALATHLLLLWNARCCSRVGSFGIGAVELTLGGRKCPGEKWMKGRKKKWTANWQNMKSLSRGKHFSFGNTSQRHRSSKRADELCKNQIVVKNLRIVARWWTLSESHLLRLYFGVF